MAIPDPARLLLLLLLLLMPGAGVWAAVDGPAAAVVAAAAARRWRLGQQVPSAARPGLPIVLTAVAVRHFEPINRL